MSCLQIYILISVFVSNLDPFEFRDWITIPIDNNKAAIKVDAKLITTEAVALIWEAVHGADPDIRPVTLEIQLDCISCTCDYSNKVIAADNTFTGWSVELENLISEKSKEIQGDLVSILTDIASIHFNGNTVGGGGPYVITLRD